MTINFIKRRSLKERLWKSLTTIVAVTTILNVSMVGVWFAPKAAQAAGTSMSVQILSWSTIGLDSNNPVTDGPHSFLIQARVTNTGAAAATDVQTTFAFGAGTSYLSLTSTSVFPLNTIAAGASKDVFYVLKITPPAAPNTPSNDAFGKTRPFTISASSPDASNASAGQTLLIEKLNSQNRNSVQSAVVSPASPLVGQPFTVTVVTTTTGGGNFDDVSPLMTYTPSLAALDSVTTHYDIPGTTQTDIYANNVGGTMTSVFHFRATAAGNQNFFYLIYDKSGGSHHYNADFGGAITVPVQPRQALTKSVDKATANPGDAITYTLNYANLGNVDLTNVVITETYDSHFIFSNATPAPTSGNNVWAVGTLLVGASGSITIHGNLDQNFAAGTTTNVHNVAVMTSTQTDPIQATADTTVTVVANGSLKLTKIVDSGSASADAFNFTIAPDPNGVGTINTTNGDYVFANLPTGTYTVTEQAFADYHQVSSTCTSVQVTPGQQATCVVHNAIDTGNVNFLKIVSNEPNADLSQFHFQVNGQGDYQSGESDTFAVGNYAVTETPIPGYSFVSASGICSVNQAGAINMNVTSNGGTCTITNVRDTGTLIVEKNVLNPDGGEVSDTHPFTVTRDGADSKTIAEGTNATYVNLPTGTYTIVELPDGDYTFVSYSVDTDANTTGAQVTVTKNGVTTLVVTNKQKPATIQVFKDVRDFQGNDIQDPTEFMIDWNNGALQVGENSGTFVDVNPGTYTFTEQNNANYTTATDQYVVTVASNEVKSITFVNWQKPSSIVGDKFDDFNGNSTWDNGEPALPGWTINLGGDANSSTTTDANGHYAFDNLKPGSYSISEVITSGWIQTLPGNNLYLVTLGVNDNQTGKTFGNFELGQISGYKFNDLNGNGTWNNGEPALQGWTINLGGSKTDSAVTDVSGFYEFSGLTAGVYSLTETQQAGWTQMSANPANVTVISGTNSQNNNFGNFAAGSISGRKFNDLNGNGSWDSGEPTIADWTIYLTKDQQQSSTQTDGNGLYSFGNLSAGTYTVSENLLTGWLQTFPPADGTYVVVITSGANITDKDFGNFELGKISGYKFNDVNGNGAWDQGEPTIAGWGMTLSNGQQTWPTTTDGSGYYEFSGVTVGTYSVSEEHRGDWTNTTPDVISGISVTSGVNSQNNNFGNFELGQISGYKFNDLDGNGSWDNGEPALPGWTINLGGADTDSTVTDANGYYEFDGLMAGSYTLTETLQAGWTQKTANPAAINVTSGTNSTDNNFGNFKNVTINAFKFNDLNGNGTKDQSEPAIAGWHITLNGGQDSTTDANGMVSWTVTTGGQYTVAEEARAGWIHTSADSVQFSVTSGDQDKVAEFLNFQLGKISGYKYNEQEQGLSDWTIYLYEGDAFIGSTTTDQNGHYEFTDLTAGTYTVSENLPSGWTQLAPDGDGTHTVVVTSGTGLGQEPTLYNFVNRLNEFSVAIEKSAPATVNAGDQMTYTLNWSVSGNIPIQNVTVTDTLPANLTYVSSNPTADIMNGQDLTWNLGTKNPGQSGSIDIVVSVASPLADGTEIENTAQVCGQGAVIDPEPESTLQGESLVTKCDDNPATTEVQSDFEVSIVKSDNVDPVEAGQNVTYTLDWTVDGNAPIDSVIVSDVLPANTTFVSASDSGSYDSNTNTVTWDLGAQANHASGSVSLTVTVDSPLADGTELTDTAKVCADSFTRTEQEVIERCDTDTEITTVHSAPSLTIVKTNDIIGFTNPGKQVTYTVVVTNAADATDTAHDVILTDLLPSGFTYVIGGGSTQDFNLGDIAPGQSVTTTYTVDISASQGAGTYTNTASAEGRDTAKVSDTSDVEVRVPQVLGAEPELNVTIVKSATPTITNPGKIVIYTLTIKNIGDVDAENVMVTDTLPVGFTFVEGGGAVKTWDLGTLGANHQRIINYEVRVGSAVKAGTYQNTAVLTVDGQGPKVVHTSVEVRVPRVLGLATTGPALRDYFLFSFGMSALAFGLYLVKRQRRESDDASLA